MIARVVLLFLCGWFSFAAGSPLDANARVVVLVFVSSECPISNKYAPELERLSRKFRTNDVAFTLVYPNASDTADKVEKHRREYRLTADFLRDAGHVLAKKAGAKVTPEAVVFNDKRDVVYRGRINDQHLALGKARPSATRHDLEEAIEAVVAGKTPRVGRTEAVGCLIQD